MEFRASASVSADALHRLRLILDARLMRELSVAEQKYQAVLAVISDGLSIASSAQGRGVASDGALVAGAL